jgi:hypothetical protein
MTSRLELVELIDIEYEIPFTTDSGEMVKCTTIPINEWREGVGISYALLEPAEQNLEAVFPVAGVDMLVKLLKLILDNLNMHPSKVILQLWEHSTTRKAHSLEERAPVNKHRDIIVIILTKTPFVYKYGYELVLWHQAMHAKDRLEKRFPSSHPFVETGEWLDILWHFSIDGRLESMGMPHYTRNERLNEAVKAFPELEEHLNELSNELWGKLVTYDQLLDIGRELKLIS